MSKRLSNSVFPGGHFVYLLLMCLLAMSGPVLAGEKSAPGQTPDLQPIIDPEADRVLKAMGDYLDSLKAFTFNSEITFDDVLPSEQKLQYSRNSKITVRRPDRIYAETTGDLGNKRLWYDGKQITLLDDDHKLYAQRAVPGTIDATLDHLYDRLGFLPPVSDLIYSDPYTGMIQDAVYGFYVGTGNVNNVRTHHLAFVQKYIDWQIWVEAGDQPKPKKLVITYKTMPSSPQFSATFRDWNGLESVADNIFTADIEGASQIEFLSARETGPAGSE